MQKIVLKQQFENFSVSNTEGLDKAYDRNKAGIDDLDIDDLYNNLKVFKADIKGSSGSSSNSQNVAFLSAEDTSSKLILLMSNSPQLDDEDLEQIDHDDLEEMDLKWQVDMLSMRDNALIVQDGLGYDWSYRECRALRNQGNGNGDAGYKSRENTRRTVPVETSDALVVQDNALIVQDGPGYDWSYISQDEPTEFALIAYTSNSPGLDSVEARFSVFDSRSCNGDDNQTNDRFKKDNGYHTVPPLLTGNYMPPLVDLSFAGLDDSIYRPTLNKTSASVSQVKTSIISPSNTSVEMPRVESVRPSGVIIKDWVSDDDEDIFQSNDLQETDKPRNNTGQKGKLDQLDILVRDYNHQNKFVPSVSLNKGNPQQAFKNKGIFDSGCSLDMTGEQRLPYLTIKDIDGASENEQALKNVLDKMMDQEKEATKQSDAVRKEFEAQCNKELFQGKATKASSTNSFNTVNTLVNTASASRTSNDAGPSFVPLGGSFPDDPLMPDLEDTAEVQNTGIFSSTYDDDDLDTYNSPYADQVMASNPLKIARKLFMMKLGLSKMHEELPSRQDSEVFGHKTKPIDLVDMALQQEVWILEQIMHKKFQMSSMGELTFFLGLQVKQKENGIFIIQDKYVGEILKKFSFSSIRTTSTPMETNKALTKIKNGEDSPFILEAFSDSDYAGASLDMISITVGCRFLGSSALDPKNQMLDLFTNFYAEMLHVILMNAICVVKKSCTEDYTQMRFGLALKGKYDVKFLNTAGLS
ncbi:ribonuclease H-like domain-containing protein [Tanacetum coccineum]